MPLHAIHDKYARYRNIIIVKGLTYVTAGSVTQKAAADGMGEKPCTHPTTLALNLPFNEVLHPCLHVRHTLTA